MTAPGQEPDEVLTGTPGGRGPAADKPDLDAIGDNHMPEDVRRAEVERAEKGADPTEQRAIPEDAAEHDGEGDTGD